MVLPRQFLGQVNHALTARLAIHKINFLSTSKIFSVNDRNLLLSSGYQKSKNSRNSHLSDRLRGLPGSLFICETKNPAHHHEES